MPSVESREVQIILLRDNTLVEALVVRMLQSDVLQALVFVIVSITNYLDLWLVGDCLEIWVKNGSLGIKGLSVAIVAFTSWVKSFGDFVLSCPTLLAP